MEVTPGFMTVGATRVVAGPAATLAEVTIDQKALAKATALPAVGRVLAKNLEVVIHGHRPDDSWVDDALHLSGTQVVGNQVLPNWRGRIDPSVDYFSVSAKPVTAKDKSPAWAEPFGDNFTVKEAGHHP